MSNTNKMKKVIQRLIDDNKRQLVTDNRRHANHNRVVKRILSDNKNKVNKGLHPVTWGIPKTIKANCYVFGLAPAMGPGGYNNKRLQKARPGDLCTNFKNAPLDFNDCGDIVKRVLCDNPKYVTKLPSTANVNQSLDGYHHLMAAILSPGLHTDFHFLRRIPLKYLLKDIGKLSRNMPKKAQDQLMSLNPKYIWVHQRGWSSGGPLIHDAKDNLITDPSKASFDYGSVNYSIYCGLFKVVTRKAIVQDYI